MTSTTNDQIWGIKPGGDGLLRSDDPEGKFRSQVGSVLFKATPTVNTVLGSPTRVQFGFPIDEDKCISIADIKVQDLNGNDVPCHVSKILDWHNWDSSSLVFLRSARITFETTFTDQDDIQNFNVVYGTGSSSLVLTDVQDKENWVNYETSGIQYANYSSIDEAKRPAYDYDVTAYGEPAANIMEPSTWVTLSKEYLQSCKALTGDVSSDVTGHADLEACLTYYENTAKTVCNEVGDHVTEENLINFMFSGGNSFSGDSSFTYSVSLFDRPTMLIALYIITGKLEWLIKAHRAAEFYSTKLNNGYFTLKPTEDSKYSYGTPLLLDAQLMGDVSITSHIYDMFEVHNTFDHEYTFVANANGLWTERHTAFKLNVLLDLYDLTGEKQYKTAATAVVDEIFRLQQTPENNWDYNGSIKHSYKVHEGFYGGSVEGLSHDSPMASPWMSALLAKALDNYKLRSGDSRVNVILAGLADWITESGTRAHNYSGTDVLIPWYLTSDVHGSSNAGDSDDVASDVMHCFDVASLVARGIIAKQELGEDYTAALNVANLLLAGAVWKFDDLHRTSQATIDEGKTIWRPNPPRSLNWWFSVNYDFIGLWAKIRGF